MTAPMSDPAITWQAEMRPFGVATDATELAVHEGRSGEAQIHVPGFGVLLIGDLRSNEPIVRLAPDWRALLVQPNAEGCIGEGSAQIPRDVRVQADGSLEVEMLHKGPDEPRLIVHITPPENGRGCSPEPDGTEPNIGEV